MDLLWLIIIAGIVMFLALVFEALIGLRIVKFKGPLHWRVHRILAFLIIASAAVHGFAAYGHLIAGWF